MTPRTLPVTRNTTAPSKRSLHRVFFIERMTVFAVRLSRILGRWADASKDVDGRRDGLKVRRIDTRKDATEMVQVESFWNRPVRFDIRPPMRLQILLADLEIRVSRVGTPGQPKPARSQVRSVVGVRAVFIDLAPKSLGYRNAARIPCALSGAIGLACSHAFRFAALFARPEFVTIPLSHAVPPSSGRLWSGARGCFDSSSRLAFSIGHS